MVNVADFFWFFPRRKISEIYSSITMILGQLPPRKIAPNPKTNPKANPNPNRGVIFLGGNCPDTHHNMGKKLFFVLYQCNSLSLYWKQTELKFFYKFCNTKWKLKNEFEKLYVSTLFTKLWSQEYRFSKVGIIQIKLVNI